MEFSLHTYLGQLRVEDASPDYIETVSRNARPLSERGLPVLLTLGHLSHATGVPYHLLLRIVKRDVDPYRVFAIRKRSGGKRFICVPDPILKEVQRWIHDHILCADSVLQDLSSDSIAYRPGGSHIKNAKRHLGADWLLKLDITQFFESITERQVFHFFRKIGYRPLVAFCLTRLCTRVLPAGTDRRQQRYIKRWAPGKSRRFLNAKVIGHLPQGAPTSPMLANYVCESLDSELKNMAQRESLVFTRYADDMTFSGDMNDRANAVRLASEVSRKVSKYGFSINSQKTNIAKSGGRKIVTGLSVEGVALRLPRSYKDEIRKELYFLDRFGLESHCHRSGQKNQFSYLLRLAGKIEYTAKVECELGASMLEKFDNLFPEFRRNRALI